MLTLYHRPGTCALAPYLALEEAGAEFRAVDLSGQPELLERVNPRGKVPVLEAEGQLLREVVAILLYIARAHPQAGLLPEAPMAAAQCTSTLAWFASTLHIDYRRFLKPQLYSPDPAAHAAISAEGGAQYRRDLDELDRQLQGRSWLHGERCSLADLYALVFVQWAVVSDLYDPRWQHITRWLHGVRQRPAVYRVLQRLDSPLLRAGG